ncbi:MAG TPA: ankyrin repeat domain-containing protein, partial [Pyrinomonadaceae bacterium]
MRFSKKAVLRSLLVAGLALCGTSSAVQGQDKQARTAGPKIIECIRSGDVACVTEFLANGGNAKAVDEKGLPLLTIAAETKSAPLVRLLINAGADVNDVGSGDGTPLCRAVLFGRKEIFQILLDAGAKADVICDSDHGDSALMEAMSGAMFSEEPFESMLKSDDLPERDAPAKDYLEIARILLARGVDVNVVAKCDVGESALMYAAMAANLEMVKALMARGAVVKEESPVLDVLRQTETEYERAKFMPVPALSRQQTAMVDWIEKTAPRREQIAGLLKAAGAKESELDQEPVDYKQMAEDYAKEAIGDVIEGDDIKDFERLVAAYVNHPLGATVLPEALRVAVIYSRVEMVKLLLARGVNPNLLTTATKYT